MGKIYFAFWKIEFYTTCPGINVEFSRKCCYTLVQIFLSFSKIKTGEYGFVLFQHGELLVDFCLCVTECY